MYIKRNENDTRNAKCKEINNIERLQFAFNMVANKKD